MPAPHPLAASRTPDEPAEPGRRFALRVAAQAGLSFAAPLLGLGVASAHELQGNRLVLVQRDTRHLQLTLHLHLLEALHRALAPAQPLREFVLRQAPSSPQALAAILTPAYAAWEKGLRLLLNGQTPLQPGLWDWPEATRVSALLQGRAMQLIADPGAHAHEEPIEVRSEAVAPREITTLRVALPPAFGRVLVVSYRPRQTWVGEGELSGPIGFGS